MTLGHNTSHLEPHPDSKDNNHNIHHEEQAGLTKMHRTIVRVDLTTQDTGKLVPNMQLLVHTLLETINREGHRLIEREAMTTMHRHIAQQAEKITRRATIKAMVPSREFHDQVMTETLILILAIHTIKSSSMGSSMGKAIKDDLHLVAPTWEETTELDDLRLQTLLIQHLFVTMVSAQVPTTLVQICLLAQAASVIVLFLSDQA